TFRMSFVECHSQHITGAYTADRYTGTVCIVNSGPSARRSQLSATDSSSRNSLRCVPPQGILAMPSDNSHTHQRFESREGPSVSTCILPPASIHELIWAPTLFLI